MKKVVVKQYVFRIFFVAECCAFIGIYAFGPHGVGKVTSIARENKILEQELEILKNEIFHLNEKIAQWQRHSFYKEKIAREQLQMAHSDEEIYYL